MLARYGHLEQIPESARDWDVPGLRGGAKLAVTLRNDFELALLFRRIATVEVGVDVGTVDEWEWNGPTPDFDRWADRARRAGQAGRASAATKFLHLIVPHSARVDAGTP